MAILNYTTKIAPEKTVAEIQARLVKNGARQLNFDYDNDGNLTALTFRIDIDGLPVFFSITPNFDGVLAAMDKSREVPLDASDAKAEWLYRAENLIKVQNNVGYVE